MPYLKRLRALIGRHRLLFAAGAALSLGLGIFVLVWFQPQKLFIEKTVNEAAPIQTPSAAASAAGARSAVLATGPFRSLEHKTTGTVRLLRLDDGSHVLRVEDLDTSNGPVLRVYLSELGPDLGWRDYGKRYLDLGGLKGNRGDQNYRVPAGTDVSKFKSVVIWCSRFSVGFGVAPLA